MSIKVLLVVVSVGVLVGALPEAEPKHHHLRVDLDEPWATFKKSFGKDYDNDLEESYRRAIWQDNLDYIQKHNIEADLGLHTYTLGVNQFADLTASEFSKLFLGTRVPPSFNETYDDYYRLFDGVDSNLPASVDWRTQGYVTPVKNQGSCGSCWAFSSTGSLEGQTFKKYKRLTPLSEQNLVDCTRKYGNNGCNGGWMANAFKYIKNNKGIDTGASYPYEGRDNVCRFKTSGIGATLKSYVSVPRSESSLQKAVANVGPISVAIDAGHSSFQLYKSGVYNEPACKGAVNHAVLVVGYGTYAGKDYWLVKNSWSTSWGNAGYIWMSRNRGNQCSIASYAIYPVV